MSGTDLAYPAPDPSLSSYAMPGTELGGMWVHGNGLSRVGFVGETDWHGVMTRTWGDDSDMG
eukprot:2261992-Rhodomonas_salina.1